MLIPLQESIFEIEPQTAPLSPSIEDPPSLGLLGEDLQLKGKHVGTNLAAMLTQSLYQAHDLRAPAKCSSTLLCLR
jgi:hypothetical protein